MKPFRHFLFLLASGIPAFLAAETAPVPVKALIVGIGTYQDSTLKTGGDSRRNAEEFAAMLRTIPGGSLEQDQILLLTDENATLARFVAALDWLLERKPEPSKRVLYFAGFGQIDLDGNKYDDTRLFLYDSPAAAVRGNTFSLHALHRLLKNAGASPFLLAVTFDVGRHSGPGLTPARWSCEKNRQRSDLLRCAISCTGGNAEGGANRTSGMENPLVAGLLGLADADGDMKVSGKELFSHLKTGTGASAGPCAFLFLALSDKNDILSRVDNRILEKLRDMNNQPLFPSIVHLESMPAENAVLEQSSLSIRRLYEDFILAVQVRRFLPPQSHNALELFDTLSRSPETKPIAGYLRRRLAAAMLDHTQQALNAYLNTSAPELKRRRANTGEYAEYAALMQVAGDLLGEDHFMRKTLKAKQLYFEGLHLRLSYFAEKDSMTLLDALAKQLAALRLEPEAAYICNELGVVYYTLKSSGDALKYYETAIKYSPTWSIPYANMCLLALDAGDLVRADSMGVKAVALAPWNPDAYAVLGFVYQKMNNPSTAETLYLRAVRLGTNLPEVYYNLACIDALKNDNEQALDWLWHAHEKGLYDPASLASDPDLVSLRDLPRFTDLVRTFYVGKVAGKKDR